MLDGATHPLEVFSLSPASIILSFFSPLLLIFSIVSLFFIFFFFFLRRGHANLLCIVPILVYVQPKLDSSRYCFNFQLSPALDSRPRFAFHLLFHFLIVSLLLFHFSIDSLLLIIFQLSHPKERDGPSGARTHRPHPQSRVADALDCSTTEGRPVDLCIWFLGPEQALVSFFSFKFIYLVLSSSRKWYYRKDHQ